MKKTFFVFLTTLCCLTASAQKKVTLKGGTLIPLQAVSQVKAADVDEGSLVDFRVTSDIKVDDIVVVPQGTVAKGKVTLAKKSTLAGTKGRLNIDITDITLTSGERIFLSNTQVRVSGKNRTPLSVALGVFVWPCIFIPGTKAVMPAGYEVQGFVTANTDLTVK